MSIQDRVYNRSSYILVVDDDDTLLKFFKIHLNKFFSRVIVVKNAQEAIETLRDKEIDLVISDIKMPRMDGVEATRAIRALDGPVSEIPIIALTANADPDDAKRYLEIGMAAVVEKPIKPERLRAAINTALSGAEAEAPAQTQPARRNKRVA